MDFLKTFCDLLHTVFTVAIKQPTARLWAMTALLLSLSALALSFGALAVAFAYAISLLK